MRAGCSPQKDHQLWARGAEIQPAPHSPALSPGVAASPPGGRSKVPRKSLGKPWLGPVASPLSPTGLSSLCCPTSGGRKDGDSGSPKAVRPGPTWALIPLAPRMCWARKEAQTACKVAPPCPSRSGRKHELALGGLRLLLLERLWGEQDWTLLPCVSLWLCETGQHPPRLGGVTAKSKQLGKRKAVGTGPALRSSLSMYDPRPLPPSYSGRLWRKTTKMPPP